MFIKCFNNCKEFIAGDGSVLRELLHPEKADLEIHYSLAVAKVTPAQITKLHKLKTSEVYYILKGEGIIHIGKESSKVCPGCAIYIPPGSRQCIENTGDDDLVFVCIVEPAWQKKDEEVLT